MALIPFYDNNLHLIRKQSSVLDEVLAAAVRAERRSSCIPVITKPLLLQQRLMSALEDKEKDLNKLKNKVDALLKNNHPASDKIEVCAELWREAQYAVITLIYQSLALFCLFTVSPHVFQAYQDTLQTQWSWLLQITKCIDVHLKENAAYSQVTSQNTQL